jgi:hypothetical protein
LTATVSRPEGLKGRNTPAQGKRNGEAASAALGLAATALGLAVDWAVDCPTAPAALKGRNTPALGKRNGEAASAALGLAATALGFGPT